LHSLRPGNDPASCSQKPRKRLSNDQPTNGLPAAGTAGPGRRYSRHSVWLEDLAMDKDKKESVPPPVISKDPEAELEKELSRHPHDLDAKVDVGSDESMDASDPSSASQPGCDDEPVPSSGFPDEAKTPS
jgi:hypothetical protein